MPHKPQISRKALRANVMTAVTFCVREDRRLLGIPEAARDQIVTYAVNEAMGYDREIIDPTLMVELDENVDVITSALEAAITAGKYAYESSMNSN